MIHINDVNGDDICWHINDVNGAIQCGFVLMLRWLKMGSHRELMWFHGDLMREIGGRNQHESMRHQQDVLSTFCHVICATKREIQPAKDLGFDKKMCSTYADISRSWVNVRTPRKNRFRWQYLHFFPQFSGDIHIRFVQRMGNQLHYKPWVFTMGFYHDLQHVNH